MPKAGVTWSQKKEDAEADRVLQAAINGASFGEAGGISLLASRANWLLVLGIKTSSIFFFPSYPSFLYLQQQHKGISHCLVRSQNQVFIEAI